MRGVSAATHVRLDIDAPIALWIVDLRLEPPPAHVAMFDATERARHQRYRFARERRRYRAAHVALRYLLANASGIAMHDQRFAIGDYGKPALVGQPALAFNMSYAGDVALIGIGGRDCSIGVDVEEQRQIDGLPSLAESVLIDSERAALMAEPAGAMRNAAFLRRWTRKEASIKALGLGLSASLDFAVGDAAQRSTTIFAGAGRVAIEVGSFMIGPSLIGAWAQRLGG